MLQQVAAMNHLRFIAETLANGMETNATLILLIQMTMRAPTDGTAHVVTTVVPQDVLLAMDMMHMTVWPATITHIGIEEVVSVIKVSLEHSVKLHVMTRPQWLTLTIHMKPIQDTTPTLGDMELMTISTVTSTTAMAQATPATDIVMVTVMTVMDQPTKIVSPVPTTLPWIVMDTVHVTNSGLVMTVASTEAHVTQAATRLVDVLEQPLQTALAASHTHLAMPTENAYVTHTGQDMTVASISDSVTLTAMDVTEPLMRTVINARLTPTWTTTTVAHVTLTGAETTVMPTTEHVNLTVQDVKDQKTPTVNTAQATPPGTDMAAVYVTPTGLDLTVAYT